MTTKYSYSLTKKESTKLLKDMRRTENRKPNKKEREIVMNIIKQSKAGVKKDRATQKVLSTTSSLPADKAQQAIIRLQEEAVQLQQRINDLEDAIDYYVGLGARRLDEIRKQTMRVKELEEENAKLKEFKTAPGGTCKYDCHLCPSCNDSIRQQAIADFAERVKAMIIKYDHEVFTVVGIDDFNRIIEQAQKEMETEKKREEDAQENF